MRRIKTGEFPRFDLCLSVNNEDEQTNREHHAETLETLLLHLQLLMLCTICKGVFILS